MRQIYLICILCFFSFPLISFTQEDNRKVIRGKLLTRQKDLSLETIYVFNKQSLQGILSDASGEFKLKMQIGDTLYVSAMQIKSVEIVIEKMHMNDAFVTLNLVANIEYKRFT